MARRKSGFHKLKQERQRESPPTGWPTGVMRMDARSLAVWLRGAQPLDGSLVDEAAEAQVEEGAQLDELVHAHLALPVQHMPEPLTIDTDATRKFGNAYPALPSRKFDGANDTGLKLLRRKIRRLLSIGYSHSAAIPYAGSFF